MEESYKFVFGTLQKWLIKSVKKLCSRCYANRNPNISGSSNSSRAGSFCKKFKMLSTAHYFVEIYLLKVESILKQMHQKFEETSGQIVSKMDEMGSRIDDLEKSIGDILQQAAISDIEFVESESRSDVKNWIKFFGFEEEKWLRDVQDIIHIEFMLPPESQVLYHNGRFLDINLTLSQSGIVEHDMILVAHKHVSDHIYSSNSFEQLNEPPISRRPTPIWKDKQRQGAPKLPLISNEKTLPVMPNSSSILYSGNTPNLTTPILPNSRNEGQLFPQVASTTQGQIAKPERPERPQGNTRPVPVPISQFPQQDNNLSRSQGNSSPMTSSVALLNLPIESRSRSRSAPQAVSQLSPMREETDPKVQQALLEKIRKKNVNNNMQKALEYHPESFGRVTMLYTKTMINGVDVKAFIDSGAQMSVISPECAEKCKITHLIDERYKGVA
ncbi:hypothetical protein HK096_007312, partial [Nowakowskiella sp. JEL0078]